MLYSRFYQISTADTEWQIGHLFEHLTLQSFNLLLSRNATPSHFISRTDGESFEGISFISGLFYTKQLADMFDAHIKELPRFSHEEIQHAIAVMQAEDKILISINDRRMLLREINKLRKRQWSYTAQQTSSDYNIKSAILTEKRSAKDFRDLVIISKTENQTLDEQKVYLRVHILIRDILHEILQDKLSCLYLNGDSGIELHEQNMAFISKYSLPKSVTLKEVRAILQNAEFRHVDSLAKILKAHFEIFSKEALWQNMPLEFFRHTGIVTTNQEISRLATMERVLSILSKTTFEVEPMSIGYEKHLL